MSPRISSFSLVNSGLWHDHRRMLSGVMRREPASAPTARQPQYPLEGGYELKKIQPVDMFPQTVHVETVILMTRGGKNDK